MGVSRTIKRLTTDAETFKREGQHQLQEGSLISALEQLGQGHTKDPHDQELKTLFEQTAYRLYCQGLTSLFAREWTEAEEIFRQIVESCGDYHDSSHLKALASASYEEEQNEWIPLRIIVSRDNQVGKTRLVQLFASLPQKEFTASFEILGIGDKVVFQAAAPRKHLHLVRPPLEAAYPEAQLIEGEDAIDEALTKASDHMLYGQVVDYVLKNTFIYPLQVLPERVDPTPGLTNLLGQIPAGLAGVQVIVSPLNREKFEAWVKMVKEGYPEGPSLAQRILLGGWTVTQQVRAEIQREAHEDAMEELEPYMEAKLSAPPMTATIQTFAFMPEQQMLEPVLRGLDAFMRQFTADQNGLVPWRDTRRRGLDEMIEMVRNRQALVPSQDRDIFNAAEVTNFWMLPWSDSITPQVEAGEIRRTFAPEQAIRIEGVPLGVNAYKDKKRPVHLSEDDRRRHLYVIGATGTGKSTFLLNLINYDLQQGHGLAVIDPKGDMVDAVLELISPERAEQVIWIDPSDPGLSVGLNPLEPVSEERRGLAASEMVSILRKLFDSWGPQLERYLRYAALTLLEVPDATMAEIPLLFMSPDFRRQALKHVTDGMVSDFWAFEFGDKPARSNVTIGAMLNRIEPFLSDQRVRHIIGQSESTFDIATAMNNGQILLADLSKGKIGEHASNLLGAMLVSKIQLSAMARANIPEERRRDFYLYVDEFQNFTTSAFETILAEARAFRLSLTMAHQYIGQLEKSVRDAVIGTVGSAIAFRVGTDDATVVARQMPGVTADELVTLDNYHALARISVEGKTSDPFDLATYPPPGNPSAMPADEVRRIARDRYTRPRSEIEEEIKQRRNQLVRVQASPSASQTQFEED